jgi:hypothetical protein
MTDVERAPVAAPRLLADLRSMLARRIDVERTLREFGQVDAAKRRAAGASFDLSAHVRGLVLAQLSNQRAWLPIARRLDAVTSVFHGFDPARLEVAPPADIVEGLRRISCGNRAIHRQAAALAANIATLRRIDLEVGLDRFVTARPPAVVAKALSAPTSPTKLRELGFTLAMEYLRNVGVSAVKPDLHLKRILGPARLGLWDGRREEELVPRFEELAREAGVTAVELDNLVWLFGARGYGELCGAAPRCEECTLAADCAGPRAAIR